ncbi:MAG TPA: DinB family protein [Terriglobales bacterium]|nr:DinB family protein [Terriglobales bacterium]
MTEIDRIADQLDRGFNGHAWHGDPLLKILEGVSAKQAAATPIANAHSIWEIVNHIRAWRSAVEARLAGQVRELAGPADWPPVTDTSDSAWRNCMSDLVQRHQSFMKAVRAFPESKLNENAPNRDYGYYVLLHGMVQHDLYHAGQIAILKKAAK